MSKKRCLNNNDATATLTRDLHPQFDLSHCVGLHVIVIRKLRLK